MGVIRINELPEASGVTSDDLLVIMDDPSGAAVTKKIPANLIGGSISPFVTVGRSGATYNATGSLESPTDHLVIQAAIDSISTTGGTIYILPGTYYISDTINISNENIAIVGSGRSSQLMCVGDYGDVFYCALPIDPLQYPGLSGLKFTDLRFETTVPRTSGAAIRAKYTHNAVFRDIYIADSNYGMSYGPAISSTPVPNPFYDGIYLDAQDQCHIEKIVAMCSHYGVHVNGSGYANSDFSYDGYIHNSNFWGVPGPTASGIGIHLGANCGGFLVDFISSNQLEYGLYANTSGTTQGGGILTIRGGYVENTVGHGYRIIGYQEVVVESLWGSLIVEDGDENWPNGTLTVMGVPRGSITYNGSGMAAIYGFPSNVDGTGSVQLFPS
jgi:hypothetical protein